MTIHFQLLEFSGRPQGPPRYIHLVHTEAELKINQSLKIDFRILILKGSNTREHFVTPYH